MRNSGLVEFEAAVAVARTKNFRAAASELGVSRSALSAAIASLEARLDTRLFHRTTRSVSCTEAGERFLAEISPALRRIHDAMGSLDTGSVTPTGTLRLNCSLSAAQQILEPFVLVYTRRHPSVHVDIVTEGRFIDIVVHGFDAGIRFRGDVPRDMVSVPLGVELRFIVVGAPALLEKTGTPTTPADLSGLPCVRTRRAGGEIYRWEFSRRGRNLSVDVDGPITLDAPELIRKAALSGCALAYLPEWLVAADLEAGRLVQVLDAWTPSSGELCLYYPGHRHVPTNLRAFVDVVKTGRRKSLTKERR